MQYVLTGSEMAACDARTSEVIGIPSLVLMERAALSVADGADDYLQKTGNDHGPVLIVAGRGNNGADGLAAGRILLDRGYTVQFLRLAGDISPGSSFDVQESILRQYGSPVRVFSDQIINEYFPGVSCGERADRPRLVIDALFGTGLSRELAGDAAKAVQFINRCREAFGSYVIAVDIASGISSDDGRVMGCAVLCNETRSFAFLKRGHLMYPGAAYTGVCHLAQIGITSRSFEKMPGMFTMSGERARDLLPERDPSGNKGTFGKIVIVAGQKNMCGAALLAGSACLACGAGMVKIFTHEANRVIIQQKLPEALLETYSDEESPRETAERLRASLDWADIAVLGPGMGTGKAAENLLRTALDYGGSVLDGMVLDADALRILSEEPDLQKMLADRRDDLPCVLTPHLAEFAALAGLTVGECAGNRSAIVQKTADSLHCTVACKDARTLVAYPGSGEGGQVIQYLNCSGNSGMATAGSGDVLTGMTAAFLAALLKARDTCGNGKEKFLSSLSRHSSLHGERPGSTGSESSIPGSESSIPGFERSLPGFRSGIPGFEGSRKTGFEAAVCAVYLHGMAGDLARSLYGEHGMTAQDLVYALRSPAFRE